ncbi:MAG TPA: HlyD family efflux transporter periplasmic adaptor subunit [Polyangiaceae bacterium]|nr:HlyD family efflux transporter periplasmic adaptor subunit [Polyangiaceae bacterium]
MVNKGGALLIALALGGGAAAFSLRPGPEPAPQGFQGVVEYEERRLGFEQAGRLVHVEVERGDTVARHAVVARMDDALGQAAQTLREEEALAARAQADLVSAGSRAAEVKAMAARVRAARASEALLASKADRERRLAAAGVTTPAALDEIEGQLARESAEREALEQQLLLLRQGSRVEEREGAVHRARAASVTAELERLRLLRHELRSPVAGTVLDVHAEPGEVVPAGAPVVSVADTTRPIVEVFVPQARLDEVRLGAVASVRVDALPDALPARVEHIADRAEFTPRYLFSEQERPNLVFRVRIRIDDAQSRLHAGLPAFVRFEGQKP